MEKRLMNKLPYARFRNENTFVASILENNVFATDMRKGDWLIIEVYLVSKKRIK
jgi:hypothetical protein